MIECCCIVLHILVSNDDGYRAPGIAVLAEALSAEHKVSVVAPERNCSGASNSLTLERGLRACEVAPDFYYVDGTPTDTVHLAITGLLKTKPDIIVSGINAGANMGDDVLYSGTVAAAMEGRHLGLPALAVSMDSYTPAHYESAANAVVHLLKNIERTDFLWPLVSGDIRGPDNRVGRGTARTDNDTGALVDNIGVFKTCILDRLFHSDMVPSNTSFHKALGLTRDHAGPIQLRIAVDVTTKSHLGICFAENDAGLALFERSQHLPGGIPNGGYNPHAGDDHASHQSFPSYRGLAVCPSGGRRGQVVGPSRQSNGGG